jgi:hypothetical protein
MSAKAEDSGQDVTDMWVCGRPCKVLSCQPSSMHPTTCAIVPGISESYPVLAPIPPSRSALHSRRSHVYIRPVLLHYHLRGSSARHFVFESRHRWLVLERRFHQVVRHSPKTLSLQIELPGSALCPDVVLPLRRGWMPHTTRLSFSAMAGMTKTHLKSERYLLRCVAA